MGVVPNFSGIVANFKKLSRSFRRFGFFPISRGKFLIFWAGLKTANSRARHSVRAVVVKPEHARWQAAARSGLRALPLRICARDSP
jgi:hypothetical protein